MKRLYWLIMALLLIGLLGTACVAVDAPADGGASSDESSEAMDDAGDYPSRPVQFVVPWPPGDLEDVLTRMIAEEMQSQTGVPAAVVNKPGGGGVVGATEVFQADPDGHTIGSFVIGIPTVQIQNGNAPYARGDFEALGIFVTYPFVIAAAGDAPYSNMEELVAYSQENDVTLGHFGFGLVPTRATLLSMEDMGGKFASEAAFDALDCATLSAGDVDVINTTIQLLLPCLDEVTILASIGSDRLAVSPDTATLGEQGGIDIMLWNGLFVRKETPQPIRDMISEIAQTALNSDAAQEVAASTGAQIYWMDAEASQLQIDSDWDVIADMVERMGQ